MKERPILFSPPMVRALLDGRKTQTRRICKPQPVHRAIKGDDGQWYDADCINPGRLMAYPYGLPTERLWVRETWSPDHATFYPNYPVVYLADGDPRGSTGGLIDGPKVWSPEQKAWYPFRWRPSIHMPRRLSRITLEVTNVRVERLQDISEADSQREGVERLELSPNTMNGMPVHPYTSDYKVAFEELWKTIHSPESWAANPWVWVISFKRIEVSP